MEVSGLTNRQLALVLAMEHMSNPVSYLYNVEDIADKLERYLETGTMRP